MTNIYFTKPGLAGKWDFAGINEFSCRPETRKPTPDGGSEGVRMFDIVERMHAHSRRIGD